METIMNKVPFVLQRKIIDYMGILPKHPDVLKRNLSDHLKTKYCSVCGEYLEIYHHDGSCANYRHYHNLINRKEMFQETCFKYEVMLPSFFIHLSRFVRRIQRISKRRSAFSSLDFDRFDLFYKNEYGRAIPDYYTIRIIYRKRLKQFIYRFNEDGVLNPIVNILDMNIFYNPDVDMIEYRMDETIPYSFSMKQPYVVTNVDSYRHHVQIKKILYFSMRKHHPTNFVFFDEYFINYPTFLIEFASNHLKECIEMMLRNLDKEGMETYMRIILQLYPDGLEWITEDELKRWFKKDRAFFIDLYDSSLIAQRYISFHEAN